MGEGRRTSPSSVCVGCSRARDRSRIDRDEQTARAAAGLGRRRHEPLSPEDGWAGKKREEPEGGRGPRAAWPGAAPARRRRRRAPPPRRTATRRGAVGRIENDPARRSKRPAARIDDGRGSHRPPPAPGAHGAPASWIGQRRSREAPRPPPSAAGRERGGGARHGLRAASQAAPSAQPPSRRHGPQAAVAALPRDGPLAARHSPAAAAARKDVAHSGNNFHHGGTSFVLKYTSFVLKHGG